MPRTGKLTVMRIVSKQANLAVAQSDLCWEVGTQLVQATNDGRSYGLRLHKFITDLDEVANPEVATLNRDYHQLRLEATIWLINWKECRVDEHVYLPPWSGTGWEFDREGALWRRTA